MKYLKLFGIFVAILTAIILIYLGLSSRISYKCEVMNCGKVFESQEDLNVHIKEIHEVAEDTLKCNFCGAVFESQEFLEDHLRLESERVKLYCVKCGEVFKTAEQLLKHTERSHPVKRN